MYELLILNQLMIIGPMHGYLIAKIINDIIGPYAKISNGRLYPLLAKLQADGLIVPAEPVYGEQKGARHSQGYSITEEGRKRWHKLMLDTTSNPGDYQRIFLQKASHLKLLNPAERLHIIDHYLNYCQAHVLHLIAERQDLAEHGHSYGKLLNLADILDTMQHMIDQWQLEVQWAQQLRHRELNEAALQESPTTIAH